MYFERGEVITPACDVSAPQNVTSKVMTLREQNVAQFFYFGIKDETLFIFLSKLFKNVFGYVINIL